MPHSTESTNDMRTTQKYRRCVNARLERISLIILHGVECKDAWRRKEIKSLNTSMKNAAINGGQPAIALRSRIHTSRRPRFLCARDADSVALFVCDLDNKEVDVLDDDTDFNCRDAVNDCVSGDGPVLC